MKKIRNVTLALTGAIVICITGLFFYTSRAPKAVILPDNIVMDVTQMNKIQVERIEQPTSIAQIRGLVKDHHGKISIGGARHSMGGQIASEKSLHLDMRNFDEIIAFSKEEKRITVQSGITWRKIQAHIDPLDLSVKIMQTYSNFTVGGSLS